MLGVYRLLALRDFNKLRNAGKEIQKIGEIIDRSDSIFNDDASLARFVAEISSKIENVGDEIEGGLAYRLTVSKRYSDYLRSLIQATAFQKIPGFETYDEFVTRKLYKIYHYNNTLADRLDRLRARLSVLQTQVQLSRIQSTQEQSNKLARVGHKVELIAVVYYGGSIIKYLLEKTGLISQKYKIDLEQQMIGKYTPQGIAWLFELAASATPYIITLIVFLAFRKEIRLELLQEISSYWHRAKKKKNKSRSNDHG